jgi:hypothetical protein
VKAARCVIRRAFSGAIFQAAAAPQLFALNTVANGLFQLRDDLQIFDPADGIVFDALAGVNLC